MRTGAHISMAERQSYKLQAADSGVILVQVQVGAIMALLQSEWVNLRGF